MEIKKIRDLTVIDLSEDKTMLIACDSCGSIGQKEMDELKIPPFFVGKFTSRVAIMEIMAAGGEIVTLTNAVCCEMEPTGREIIEGIKVELAAAKIKEAVLTGSTEENFKTFSTAVGITVVGITEKRNLKINNIRKACKIISIGIPKVGSEICLENDTEIASYEDISTLLNCSGVQEIVPVGSKGIFYEADLLSKCNGMKLVLTNNLKIDIRKTCGPSTVIIAAIDETVEDFIKSKINNVNIIGRFI